MGLQITQQLTVKTAQGHGVLRDRWALKSPKLSFVESRASYAGP